MYLEEILSRNLVTTTRPEAFRRDYTAQILGRSSKSTARPEPSEREGTRPILGIPTGRENRSLQEKEKRKGQRKAAEERETDHHYNHRRVFLINFRCRPILLCPQSNSTSIFFCPSVGLVGGTGGRVMAVSWARGCLASREASREKAVRAGCGPGSRALSAGEEALRLLALLPAAIKPESEGEGGKGARDLHRPAKEAPSPFGLALGQRPGPAGGDLRLLPRAPNRARPGTGALRRARLPPARGLPRAGTTLAPAL